jgi:hypothetical protein
MPLRQQFAGDFSCFVYVRLCFRWDSARIVVSEQFDGDGSGGSQRGSSPLILASVAVVLVGGLAGLPQQPTPIDGRSTAIRGWTQHHGWAGLRTCNSLWPAFADATLDMNVVHAII